MLIKPRPSQGSQGQKILHIVSIVTNLPITDTEGHHPKIASLKKPTGQDAKPQLHLIEPGAMFGGKVEHMLMARIAQEGTPLDTAVQLLCHTGYIPPLGDQTADIEAPVGI